MKVDETLLTVNVRQVLAGLSTEDIDSIYRAVRAYYVAEDIIRYAKDTYDKDITDDDAQVLSRDYASGEYDCNLSYWSNLDALLHRYQLI